MTDFAGKTFCSQKKPVTDDDSGADTDAYAEINQRVWQRGFAKLILAQGGHVIVVLYLDA